LKDALFIKPVKPDKHNPEFYPKIKNNVMVIFGTHRNEARGSKDCFDYCKATKTMSKIGLTL
jgi:hypothetical protein